MGAVVHPDRYLGRSESEQLRSRAGARHEIRAVREQEIGIECTLHRTSAGDSRQPDVWCPHAWTTGYANGADQGLRRGGEGLKIYGIGLKPRPSFQVGYSPLRPRCYCRRGVIRGGAQPLQGDVKQARIRFS